MPHFVYIMASRKYGTLYVGVTNDLAKRVYQHRNGLAEGFTKRYGIKTLVFFEAHSTKSLAIEQERRIKRWRRDWKIELIEANNPYWEDLYPGLGH